MAEIIYNIKKWFKLELDSPIKIYNCLDHNVFKTLLPAYCFVVETSVTDHEKSDLKSTLKLKFLILLITIILFLL